MAPPNGSVMQTRKRQGRTKARLLRRIETDAGHHLTGPFMTQTPIGSETPEPNGSPVSFKDQGFPVHGLWADLKSSRWVVEPDSSFKLLMIPILLYINWHFVAPYIASDLPNPFEPLLFISHRVISSPDESPRYAKGYYDLLFIGYYVIFFSFLRQFITITICRPIARYFRIKKPSKLERFGEQGYALVYFATMGAWGFQIMSQLPTWWYHTDRFWIDYPHWQMTGGLKRFYLMHSAYWFQQLIVLLLRLEKPRKDYNELAAHHFVTLWLIGWSYLVNLTFIGNAVYMSMDIPDAFLAFSKLLNYIQWERAKVMSFITFICVWTYFRHYLNLVMLWSVWFEFDLIPEAARMWKPEDGVWLTWWMKYQIFIPMFLLQLLNLFWYYLIWRVLMSTIIKRVTTDERSDDEDEDDDEHQPLEK